ncbi:MAG: glycosyltransferase family 4 protein [Magnetococcales bacterium]|nr:glycosyltransferase family 4 protein [Magnetococcales bacterium]
MSHGAPPRVGFLVYDLKPFTADYLARIARRFPGRLRAYPILDGPVPEGLPYTYRPSRLAGRFFSVRRAGATPEGFLSSINWGGAWACARENDVVILSGIQGGSAMAVTLFARLLGRSVISVNQTLPPAWEARRRWWIRLLKGWVLRQCRVHLTQTPITRATLSQVYGIPEERMVDAPFEAGATAFGHYLSGITRSRESLRQEFGWSPDECVFLFVGTLLRFKGVLTLLDAVADLAQRTDRFRVICIGEKAAQPDEPAIDDYRRLASERGIAGRIGFPGSRPLAELAAAYLAADALLLPTQKDCFPKVLVEAALAGLPLVTTSACGAAGALVADMETGCVIPPDDPVALTRAMTTLLDPALRQRLGERARATCLAFCDPDKETEGFLTAIQRAAT